MIVLFAGTPLYTTPAMAGTTAQLAQSVEHGTLNPGVAGASPTLGDLFSQAAAFHPSSAFSLGMTG